MALVRNSLAEIYNYTQQVPNLAPNERFLPNADYGRIGALKLAENVFSSAIDHYIEADATGGKLAVWGRLGQYHYYLLQKDLGLQDNEEKRVGLNAAPTPNDYDWGNFDVDMERNGPLYQGQVMRIIANIASIYGFPIQTLTSAILTIAKGKMFRMNPLLNLNANYLDAFHMVRYNFSLIESMWGIRGSGYPNTYYRGSKIAARNDYGKGGKGKNGRKKRKRSRYY